MLKWLFGLFHKDVKGETSDPPICKNCRHQRYDNLCYKNAYVHTDYSTGKEEEWGWEFCSREREDGSCGAKGRNFQFGYWNPMRSGDSLPQRDMGKPEKRCEDCAYSQGYPGGMVQDFTCERTRTSPTRRDPVTGELEPGDVWPCWSERREGCGKKAKYWKPRS